MFSKTLANVNEARLYSLKWSVIVYSVYRPNWPCDSCSPHPRCTLNL